MCPCLERCTRGGNKGLGVSRSEVVVDPLRVSKVFKGRYSNEQKAENSVENSYISRMRERKGGSRDRKSKLGRKERAKWKESISK